MRANFKCCGYQRFIFPAAHICSLKVTKPDWRWQLTSSGRFAHRRQYVEEVGKRNSLRTVYYERLDGFRFENGMYLERKVLESTWNECTAFLMSLTPKLHCCMLLPFRSSCEGAHIRDEKGKGSRVVMCNYFILLIRKFFY